MPAKDTDKTFKAANDAFEQFTAPWRELTEIALQNTEKMSKAHIDSLTKFTGIGLENAKVALTVKDVAGVQEFAQGQRDVIKQVSDQLATDVKTMTELSSNFMTAAQKTCQETLTKAAKTSA